MKQNIWVYKPNGNDITVKTKDLTKVREHVYYYTEDQNYATWTQTNYFLVLEYNGVYVYMGLVSERSVKEEITWERFLEQVNIIIEGQRYFNNLELKIIREYSEQLYLKAVASRQASIRRQEENRLQRLKQQEEEERRKKMKKQRQCEERKRIVTSLKGILKDGLTTLQQAAAVACLMQEKSFRFDGKTVCCTYYDLITIHGFNKPDMWTEEYNHDGSLKARPVNHYGLVRQIPEGNSGVCFDIPGRLGALMIQDRNN